MDRKKYIIIFLASSICIFVLMYLEGTPQYPTITENATVLKYHDETERNPGNHIGNGVRISYIDGHRENVTLIWFDDYRPYKRLEMYESNDVFIIIYDEENNGEKKDRFLSLKGRPGYKSIGEYKVEVYRNGKRVRNVKISFGME